jgi:putative phosphoesterase
VTLAIETTRSVRLVVVADTHSRPHPELGNLIASLEPAAILHAGDIGDLTVLDQLAAHAPVHAIRGNIDARAPHLPDHLAIVLPGSSTTILMTHYALRGPRLRAEIAEEAASAGASVVVCGHSHVPFVGRDRGLTVFNPGSCGPRRFSLPILFGVLDVHPDGLAFAHVSCESGQQWRPGR